MDLINQEYMLKKISDYQKWFGKEINNLVISIPIHNRSLIEMYHRIIHNEEFGCRK